MGLPDHEERAFAQIEQQLADDARFAAKIRRTRSWMGIPRPVLFAAALLATYLAGLVAIIAGVSLSSASLVVLGSLIAAAFPTLVAARAWRARRR